MRVSRSLRHPNTVFEKDFRSFNDTLRGPFALQTTIKIALGAKRFVLLFTW